MTASHELTAPDDADRWVGRLVEGRYRVLERIGRGAMGLVYRVEHVRMGKIAALKLLHRDLVADPTQLRRFQHEAEAVSRLDHPHIVQVFDFGPLDDTFYLVMEYLRGEDLSAVVKRDGPLSLQRTARILAQVCDALSEAHHHRIVHRDLKPENIRVTRTRGGDDFVKVLDFGLAKTVAPQAPPDSTGQGALVGTPHYMAPEQIRGGVVDHRSDLYSLGAVAYRLLTGRPPFEGRTAVAVLTKHITEELVAPSRAAPERRLPQALDPVLGRALAKRPEDRFPSAEALKEALLELAERAESGELEEAAPSGDAPRRRASDRQPTGPGVPPFVAAALVDSVAPLSREDLAFERRLRRARWVKLLALFPLLGAVAVGTYLFAFRTPGEVVSPEEREPNDRSAAATLVLPRRPILGQLGKRQSDTESDRDWYRFSVDGVKRRFLTARLSSLPNLDVRLELYDHAGSRLATADSTGVGAGEVLPSWPLGPGSYFVLVRETPRPGARATENVTDRYRLELDLADRPPEWELEPNDDEAQATSFPPGGLARGTLGGREDRDSYRLEGNGGALDGEVSALPGVDLVLELRVPAGAEPRVIDQAGAGEGERLRGLKVPKGSSAVLTVRRASSAKPPAGTELPALETPYSLRLVQRPPAP
ncbi:MAG: serine/threonine protein kinase [Deltaproteobacteria bacterium]|nr:serine/threonine protein kinase [Deltaproteobacteria bacterium]